MRSLDDWIKAAEAIQENQQLTQHGKDVRLASLMTDMEGEYQIPMLRNPEWEEKHPGVLQTYRRIGDMREL